MSLNVKKDNPHFSLPSPSFIPVAQPQILSTAQTIAFLSTKFDEIKNTALNTIAQLEIQIVSLNQQLQKKDASNVNTR